MDKENKKPEEDKNKELAEREKRVAEREKAAEEREKAAMSAGKTTRMIQPLPGNTKMMKLRAIRAFSYTGMDGQKKTAAAGAEVDVPEFEANEILKRCPEGTFMFSGERYDKDGDVSRHQLKYAEMA